MTEPRRIKGFAIGLLVFGFLVFLAVASYLVVLGQVLGSKTFTAMALLTGLAPVLIYASIERPLLFPFSLFAMLAPVDELLGLSKFGTLLRFIAAASAGAMIFWMIRHRDARHPPLAAYVWGILTVWMALSIFWALDPGLAMGRMGTVLQLLLLYLTCCFMPATWADVKLVLGAVGLGGVLSAIYGVYYFHENQNVASTLSQRLVLSNGHDFIDPNHFAAAMILPITIVTGAWVQTRNMTTRVWLAMAGVVLFMGIYATGSRGGLLGAAVAVGYLAWRSGQRLRLLAILGLAAIGSSIMPTSIWSRFSNALSSHGAGREDIWRVGLEAFKHFWLFGAGLENFPTAFSRVYMNVFTPPGIGWGRAAHNLLMQVGVELGLMGLGLTLTAWVLQFSMLEAIPRGSRFYTYRLMVQAGLIGLFVAAMFLDILYRKYTWLAFIVSTLVYTAWQSEVAPAVRGGTVRSGKHGAIVPRSTNIGTPASCA
jgi:O-antigen ligase